MRKSIMDASIFGIGELITQRKLFRVPEHQRDFAWTKDDVEHFLDDIESAVLRKDPDYFIGLVVLLGSKEGIWQILDGQQRLAVTTMVFSAMRQWLAEQDYQADAQQIEAEFIAVRTLGGRMDSSPRLTLNAADNEAFKDLVVNRCPTDEIERRLRDHPRHSPRRRLIEAVFTCRTWLHQYLEKKTADLNDQADKLFTLSHFFESGVRVACLDVPYHANAFIIFEALNDRSNRLSALDLVKNYLFSQAGTQTLDKLRRHWGGMIDNLGDRNPDDFLKVYWTSRFGRVQRTELFDKLQDSFRGQIETSELARDLEEASAHYSALDDPEHEVWLAYSPTCRRQVQVLNALRSRQVRAPIMAAIGRFPRGKMEQFLWSLICLTVRYQIVGKRRTGALEILCAKLASLIYNKKIKDPKDLHDELRTIAPSDEDFYDDFVRYSEPKASRAAYFLAQLEITARELQGAGKTPLVALHQLPTGLSIDFIVPSLKGRTSPSDELDEWVHRLGNRCLLEDSLVDTDLRRLKLRMKIEDYYKNSELVLTRCVNTPRNVWGPREIDERQRDLAKLAVKTWSLSLLGQL
jgi:hypothetical protein